MSDGITEARRAAYHAEVVRQRTVRFFKEMRNEHGDRYDSGHSPAFARQPQKRRGAGIQRIPVIVVHVGDDALFGLGKLSGASAVVHEVGAFDPFDPAESGHQMGPLDGNGIKCEVLEIDV